MQIDLSALSMTELMDLEKDVKKAIATAEKRARKEAIAEIKAVALKHGLSLNEVMAEERVTTGKSTAAPKYANPADASQMWSGRGRRPQWVKDALDSGKSLDDLAI